ncbi:MAG: adaptor protein MecA [Lachnospiraceae bacterium]|nr:adaptor protein MecA [Lachnospiraceae bacterium]
MFFKKLNPKTIRCIITEHDMNQYGIVLDDIFERKQKAIDFIRGVISKAVEAEDFRLSAEAASMKITVMPDRSLSLTLSMDPHESPEEALLEAHTQDQYIYRFDDLWGLVRCCRHLGGGPDINSSLYYDEENGDYYLFIMRTEGVHDYERMALSANEFGEMIAASSGRIAFFREHLKCLIPENTIRILSRI